MLKNGPLPIKDDRQGPVNNSALFQEMKQAISLAKGLSDKAHFQHHHQCVKNRDEYGWQHVGNFQFRVEDHVEPQAHDHDASYSGNHGDGFCCHNRLDKVC